MIAALIIFSFLFEAVSIAALIIFILVRTTKPIVAWAIPKVRRVVHRSVDAVEGVIAGPVWAQAVPHCFRREQLKLNEKYKMVYLRFAGLKPHDVYRVDLKRDQFCDRCEPHENQFSEIGKAARSSGTKTLDVL
jgi:hypothetical protein